MRIGNRLTLQRERSCFEASARPLLKRELPKSQQANKTYSNRGGKSIKSVGEQCPSNSQINEPARAGDSASSEVLSEYYANTVARSRGLVEDFN